MVEPANISLPTGSSPELNTGDNNTLNNSPTSGCPLQVGYTEAGQDYTLYLVTHREQDRDDWINALRSGKFIVLTHEVYSVSCMHKRKHFSLL